MTLLNRMLFVASLALLQACAPSTQAPAATGAADAPHNGQAAATPPVATASTQAPGDPHQACNLLTAAELSTLVGLAMVATSHEGDGVSNCNYAPAGGHGSSVDFTVMRGDGASTLRMDRDMAGHDAAGDKRFAGIGDDAVAVPPTVQVRAGEDLLVFTLFGIADEPAFLRKAVAIVKPKL